jgi:hypothetical protein
MLTFYGCIVDIGVGDGDAIGDALGYGCAAVAARVVAVATNVPARMIPTNHRLIELVPSLWWLRRVISTRLIPRRVSALTPHARLPA